MVRLIRNSFRTSFRTSWIVESTLLGQLFDVQSFQTSKKGAMNDRRRFYVWSMATVTEIETELLTNLDYEETGSVSKAKRAVTLLRQLIVKRRTSASHEGSSHSFDHASLKQMLDEAQAYVNANSNNGGVRFLGMGSWR